MKNPFLITILLFSTLHITGQVNQTLDKDTLMKESLVRSFYINDTLLSRDYQRCFALTKGNNLRDIMFPDIIVKTAVIIDNCLKMDFSYGCGCGPIYVKLFVDTSLDLVNEPAIHLYLQFVDLDTCKAGCDRSVYFDLSTILGRRKKPLIIQVGNINLTVPGK